MTKRIRLMSIIISIVLLCSAVIGLTTYLVINEINKGKALKDSATATRLTNNIYTTTQSGGKYTINPTAINELLSAINYSSYTASGSTYKAHDIATRNGSTSGNTILFPMGYYVGPDGNVDTSKPLMWQIVYLWGDYITVWLDKPYTVSDYNDSGVNVSTSSPFSNYSGNAPYSDHSNYSKSVLRDVTNNIFDLLNDSLAGFGGDNGIIVSPANAGATWQATQTEDVHTISSSYYDHHNGLQSYSGNYNGWANSNWDSTNPPYNDEFWIPSSVEVLNQSASGTSTTNGLWGLTANDYGYGTGTNSNSTEQTYQGENVSGTYNYYCWLRSGSR